MTAAVENLIYEPGVYEMTEPEYRADPVAGGSVTQSGLRRLLPPGCPAKYRYERDHPQPHHTEAFDHGHAAHALVLGAGPELVLVDAPDWRTKAAREARDDAHDRGAVPLLPDDWQRVHDMAQALRADPVAAALLGGRGSGKAEQTLVWVDGDSGVWCRARVDWLPDAPLPTDDWRLFVPDYKTCRSAEPAALSKAIAEYGYHQQAGLYLDGVAAVHHGGPAVFLLICQEKTPPHLVTVVQMTELTLAIGRDRNRRALAIYRQCMQSGSWPGYASDVADISLPAYLERQYLEDL